MLRNIDILIRTFAPSSIQAWPAPERMQPPLRAHSHGWKTALSLLSGGCWAVDDAVHIHSGLLFSTGVGNDEQGGVDWGGNPPLSALPQPHPTPPVPALPWKLAQLTQLTTHDPLI